VDVESENEEFDGLYNSDNTRTTSVSDNGEDEVLQMRVLYEMYEMKL